MLEIYCLKNFIKENTYDKQPVKVYIPNIFWDITLGFYF